MPFSPKRIHSATTPAGSADFSRSSLSAIGAIMSFANLSAVVAWWALSLAQLLVQSFCCLSFACLVRADLEGVGNPLYLATPYQNSEP